MSISCPACGGSVDLAERPLPVLNGVCPNCSREVFLLAPGGPVPRPTAAEGATSEEAESEAPAAAAGLSIPHPGDDCDGNILLTAGGPDRLTGTCDDCGEEFTFVLSGGEEAEEEERPMRRPAPRFRAPREMERGGGRFDQERPARPCRQCGGPLTFETGEDGTVTGRCSSCGNTFTLPRRREGRGGDRGDRDRRPSYGRGGPRRFGGGGGRREYGGRSDDRPRARRTRRDE